MSCLLLIDLQNEFISPGGKFQVHDSCRIFLENVGSVVNDFRSNRYPIFWIRSEYGSSERSELGNDSDSFLSGTHTGRNKCCEKGSFGAQFPEDIAALIDADNDLIVTKTWYSAFKETPLLSDLNDRGITNLFIGGLLTNVCVQATATDAVALGFHVHVLENCLGWRNRGSHDKALQTMRDLGIQVTSSTPVEKHSLENIPAEMYNTELQPQVPALYYVNGSIPSWRVMMALFEKVCRDRVMFFRFTDRRAHRVCNLSRSDSRSCPTQRRLACLPFLHLTKGGKHRSLSTFYLHHLPVQISALPRRSTSTRALLFSNTSKLTTVQTFLFFHLSHVARNALLCFLASKKRRISTMRMTL